MCRRKDRRTRSSPLDWSWYAHGPPLGDLRVGWLEVTLGRLERTHQTHGQGSLVVRLGQLLLQRFDLWRARQGRDDVTRNFCEVSCLRQTFFRLLTAEPTPTNKKFPPLTVRWCCHPTQRFSRNITVAWSSTCSTNVPSPSRGWNDRPPALPGWPPSAQASRYPGWSTPSRPPAPAGLPSPSPAGGMFKGNSRPVGCTSQQEVVRALW